MPADRQAKALRNRPSARTDALQSSQFSPLGVQSMATHFTRPAGSQRPPGDVIMELLQQFSRARSAAAAPTYATGEVRVELLRQILKATFAEDSRGRRLRDAWSMVGMGLTTLLREFADHVPAPEDR